MTWIPYGPAAWLLRFAGKVDDDAFARGCAIVAELERNPPEGLLEFVPAYTSILLEFAPAQAGDASRALPQLTARLEQALTLALPPSCIHEIPVIYDGADLDRVARRHELTTIEVARLHSAPLYKVYQIGFSPGFPYLGDLDERLHTPRLSNPRARVPAGSVAIGGEHTGIYSVDGPGGWNLIGRTSVKLFEACGPKFLLRQGDRVKFVADQTG